MSRLVIGLKGVFIKPHPSGAVKHWLPLVQIGGQRGEQCALLIHLWSRFAGGVNELGERQPGECRGEQRRGREHRVHESEEKRS